MNVDPALAAVLNLLSDAQIEALAVACDALTAPNSSLAQVVAGAQPGTSDAVAALTSAWRTRGDLTGPGVALALRIGLAARRQADAARARPVWTGPDTIGEQRLTAAVLHELLTNAQDRILLVSYAAYTLAEVASDLAAAVERGCQVDVVFETEEDSAGAYSGPHSAPFGAIAGLNRWCWPAEHRLAGAVLHAKLLVVDGQRALIGSANLTHRALAVNLEAGVLLHDAAVAADLEGHIRRMMAARILIRGDH